MSLQDLIESFLNGNISDAKKRAKRRSHRDLREALKDAKHYLEIHADDPRTRNFISLQLNPVISKATE